MSCSPRSRRQAAPAWSTGKTATCGESRPRERGGWSASRSRPSQASFDASGNILTNTAFLHGLAAEELSDEEFGATDPYFPAVTGIRARKSAQPERVESRGVVLLYHRLDDVADVHDVSVPPGLFEQHLQWLQANCTVMPVSELLRAAPEDLPDRAVGITFDDGYLDNLTMAAPLLSRYGVPATFFVTSRWLERPGEYLVGHARADSPEPAPLFPAFWKSSLPVARPACR